MRSHHARVANKVEIEIDVDGKGGLAAIQALNGGFARLDQQVRQTASKLNNAFSGLSTSQKVLAGLGAGAGLLALGFAATIGPAVKFESAFAGVKKTVDGTPQQLDAIRTGILDMSSTMPVAADQLADIAANAGQLGVKAPQVLEFTRTIAMLGETTDLDFDSAAQSLARFLNITGNDVPISRLADVLVDLGNNSATTESQIVDFSTRLASAFTSAGAAEEDILALAASFSSLGLRAEAGGSALSTIITVISDAAIDGGSKLQVLADVAGVIPDRFREMVKENPVDALLAVGYGMGEILDAGGSLTPILESLDLAGLRTSEAFRLLALNTVFVQESVNRARRQMEEGGAAAAEYAARMETVEAKFRTFGNALRRVAIDIGTVSLDALAKGLDGLQAGFEDARRQLAPFGSALADTFENIARAAEILGKALVLPALKVAAAALLGLADTAALVLTAFNALGPVGPIILGLGAAIAFIPQVATAARAAMLAFAISTSATGAASTAAAAGVGLLNAALAVGPYALAAAGLVTIGKVMYDFRNATRDAADAYRSEFTRAIEGADVEGLANRLDELKARQRELEEAAYGSGSAFDRFTYTVQAAAEAVIPFGQNATRDARAELEGLNEALETEQPELFAARMEQAGSILGITSDQAAALAESLGLTSQVATFVDRDFFAAVQSMKAFTTETGASAEKLDQVTAALETSQPTLDLYGEALGLSAENVARLAEEIDGVSLEDLFSEDQETRAEALRQAMGYLQEEYGRVAAAVFDVEQASERQVEQVFEEIAANSDLISSMDDLGAAIERVNAIRESAFSQQARLNQAQTDYQTALENFNADPTEEAFIALATEAGKLNAAFAASGVSLEEAKAKNAELAAAMIDLGAQTGLAEEDVLRFVATLTGIPEEELIKLQVDGEEATAEVERFIEEQVAALPDEIRMQIIIEEAQENANIIDRMEAFAVGWENTTAVAEISVDEPLSSETLRQNLDAFMAGWEGRGARAEVEVDETGESENTRAEVDTWITKYGLTTTTATVDLNSDPFNTKRDLTRFDLDVFDDTTATATLDADENPARSKTEIATGAADDYADGDYTATLDADSGPADAARVGIAALLVGWAVADYTAQLRADPTQALAATNQTRAAQLAMTNADYTALLKANAGPAVAAANYARSVARAFAAGGYTATLRAIDRASGVIYGAVAALRQFRSKTIYLTAISRTGSANGNIFAPGGAQVFADGGFSNPVIERPGPARIYRAHPRARLFAEPETHGESYIPLNPAKRARSLDIWLQTGRLLGALDRDGQIRRFADGGIVPAGAGGAPRPAPGLGNLTLSVEMPVTITTGSGDPETIGRTVKATMRTELDNLAREIRNRR